MGRCWPPRLRGLYILLRQGYVCVSPVWTYSCLHVCVCRCQHTEISRTTLYWAAALATLSLTLGLPIILPFRIYLQKFSATSKARVKCHPLSSCHFPHPLFFVSLYFVLLSVVMPLLYRTQNVNPGSMTSLRSGCAHAQPNPVLHGALLEGIPVNPASSNSACVRLR